MNKTKLWLVQIVMITIVSLAFGMPVLAAPPAKTVKAETTDGIATQGEEMRLDNANLEEGNADWKTGDTPPDPDPVCTSSDTSGCTVENCEPSGGSWNDSTGVCSFF